MIAGYDIADSLAWDAATWDRLLSSYHADIWPAQVVALGLFVAALLYWIKSARQNSHAPLMLSLAACWTWVGLSFHAEYHAQLNWAAHYWVFTNLIQAVLLLALAMVRCDHRLHANAWRAWLVCLVLSSFLAVLIGLLWGRPVLALSWPLLSPDTLAWVTLLTLVAWAALTRRQWMVSLALIVPTLVLLIDGFIAFSLPAFDRLTIVSLAFVSTVIARNLITRAQHQRSDN